MSNLAENPTADERWSAKYLENLAMTVESAAESVWAGPAIEGDLALIDQLRTYAKEIRLERSHCQAPPTNDDEKWQEFCRWLGH